MMRILLVFGFCLLFGCKGKLSLPHGEDEQKIVQVSLPCSKIKNVTAAKLTIFYPHNAPRAAIVICPPENADGQIYALKEDWRHFCYQNNLALVALTLTSNPELLRKGIGYFYPEQGSGRLIMDAISDRFGSSVPLFLFGASGGAHFVSGLAVGNQKNIKAWSAYSAGWWPQISSSSISSPGLIGCGNLDGSRFGASYEFFMTCRSYNARVLWVELKNIGHERSDDFESLTMEFFKAILERPLNNEERWISIETGVEIGNRDGYCRTSLGWVPSQSVEEYWNKIRAQ